VTIRLSWYLLTKNLGSDDMYQESQQWIIIQKLSRKYGVQAWKIGFNPRKEEATKEGKILLDTVYIDNLQRELHFFLHPDIPLS
jgi:hypothetical protein